MMYHFICINRWEVVFRKLFKNLMSLLSSWGNIVWLYSTVKNTFKKINGALSFVDYRLSELNSRWFQMLKNFICISFYFISAGIKLNTWLSGIIQNLQKGESPYKSNNILFSVSDNIHFKFTDLSVRNPFFLRLPENLFLRRYKNNFPQKIIKYYDVNTLRICVF